MMSLWSKVKELKRQLDAQRGRESEAKANRDAELRRLRGEQLDFTQPGPNPMSFEEAAEKVAKEYGNALDVLGTI
jgi:hypothetical protein